MKGKGGMVTYFVDRKAEEPAASRALGQTGGRPAARPANAHRQSSGGRPESLRERDHQQAAAAGQRRASAKEKGSQRRSNSFAFIR